MTPADAGALIKAIHEIEIREIQDQVQKEVVNNSEYSFEEEDYFEVDLSDLDLED